MSLSRIILSLLVALLLGATSLLQAEDAPAGGKGGVKGSITAIDADKKTVSIKGDGDAVVYTTNDSTKISIDRKPAALGDLKVGDTAFVRVDTTDKTLAVRIGVKRGDTPAK
jgi:hypothetical protein